jgi:hypothetical protein
MMSRELRESTAADLAAIAERRRDQLRRFDMSDVAPVSPTLPEGPSTAPGGDDSSAELQQAFSDGVLKFMVTMLQSAQSDITDAINDTTSDPDDPS